MTRFSLHLLVLGTALLVRPAAADAASDLRLVPFPKEAALLEGEFDLQPPLVLEAPAGQAGVLAHFLNEPLREAGLAATTSRTGAGLTNQFSLSHTGGPLAPPAGPLNTTPGAYRLEVRPGSVVCVAATPEGLFHGLQTLGQLIRANRRGTMLPALAIHDFPSLRWRCFQDDMTRGPSSKLETLKFEAALGAALKFNLMTFYMEYQFAFRKHPNIGPPDGSLTPEDLAALVAFVQPLHLDILGNQQSFGHFGQILKHPQYAPLRETPDVLTPVKEETYQLLDDLYSEVCPLLPFPWFNVCCDETWGLGTGPSKERARQVGVGGVYVEHIRRVHDLLERRHKRMMMWGDIILQHPNHLPAIPKDTIMLTWGYDARASFEDQILPFARSGYEFLVCPGVNNWSRILPDFGVAMTNIRNFVRDGAKHGALGMLNTDWEDDGEAINAVKWHADAWAAECAWNAAATPPEVFNRRVGAVLFGESSDRFGQAVEGLARTHRLSGMQGMNNSRFWEDDFAPRSVPTAVQASASNLLAIVQPAMAHLEACQKEAVANRSILDAFLFGARRMERIGLRMRDGLEAAQLYEKAYDLCQEQARTQAPEGQRPAGRAREEIASLVLWTERLVRTNRTAHEDLGRQFAALWLTENKPYALDWTLKRYASVVSRFDGLLRKLQEARALLEAGQPLPRPEQVGLALPEVFARRARPHQMLATPLLPDASWAEPSATHRLGLVVKAGSVDRFELPVEMELTLPPEVAGKPVRAFHVSGNGSATEILAQTDPGSRPGRSRLVLVLPGPLAKGAMAMVHVYLGLPAGKEPLPQAVTMHPADGGMVWIENNQVRLLLGPEGGHIYRCEIKSARGRDLTEPGETGWAGFCDMGTHRGEAYRLIAAAQGPAMVRYQCVSPSGHIKVISLFGGASWFEVTLNEPTPLYWDFDSPRNFAADGPAPGTYLFSNGATGPVGRQADGVPAQVKARGVFWSIKFNQERMALGLATPETAAFHLVAPGSGAGGVGIENSSPASHFITFAGRLEHSPAETMNRLRQTLDLRNQPEIVCHSLQAR